MISQKLNKIFRAVWYFNIIVILILIGLLIRALVLSFFSAGGVSPGDISLYLVGVFVVTTGVLFVLNVLGATLGESSLALPEEIEYKSILQEVFKELQNLPSKDEVEQTLSTKSLDNFELANPQLQPIAFALKPRSKFNFIKGVVFESVICLILIPWLLILVISHIWDFTGFSRVLFRRSIKKGIQLSRRSRRYRISPHNRLKQDTRTPILYLRSFSDDDADGFVENFIQKTYEEKMVSKYNKNGPVIAVGNPKEHIPLLGAHRIYFPDDIWKEGVLYLMSVSHGVVIHASYSPGTLWELGAAKAILPCQKLIISFYSWSDFSYQKREEYYSRFKRSAEQILKVKMPDSLNQADYMYFESNWNPIFFTNQKK